MSDVVPPQDGHITPWTAGIEMARSSRREKAKKWSIQKRSLSRPQVVMVFGTPPATRHDRFAGPKFALGCHQVMSCRGHV